MPQPSVLVGRSARGRADPGERSRAATHGRVRCLLPADERREAPARDRLLPRRAAAPGRLHRCAVRGPRRDRYGLRGRPGRGHERRRQAHRRQDRGEGEGGRGRCRIGTPVRHAGERRQGLHRRHAAEVGRRLGRGEVEGRHLPAAARGRAALPEGQRGVLGPDRLGRQARRQVREGARGRPLLQAVPRLHRHGRPAGRAAGPGGQARQGLLHQGRAHPRGPGHGGRGQGRQALGVPGGDPVPAAHGAGRRRRPGGTRGVGQAVPARPARAGPDGRLRQPAADDQGEGGEPAPAASKGSGQGANPTKP